MPGHTQQPVASGQLQLKQVSPPSQTIAKPSVVSKKSNASLIIGVVTVIALAVVLVVANMLGLFSGGTNKISNESTTSTRQSVDISSPAQPTSGNTSASPTPGLAVINDEAESFTFDTETIAMFGSMESFAQWLYYEAEVDPEDLNTSLLGEYSNSYVELVSEERSWLEGYGLSAAFHIQQQMENQSGYTHSSLSGEDAPDYSLPGIETDEWPFAYLPADTPVYPAGDVRQVYAEPGMISIYVDDVSTESFLVYVEALKDSGWDVYWVDEDNLDGAMAQKGSWTFSMYLDKYSDSIRLSFYYNE
ncbi:MAG: hypothetical protein FWE76_01040 [Symbiobacteriaceae bacterium]|nr:hypothetical protein [Symbiobacteriaceae bacterium]